MEYEKSINRKRRVIQRTDHYDQDNFSLKRTFKKIGRFAKDVGKLAVQPLAKSLTSITGKEYKQWNTFDTKLGRIAGKVQGAGSNALHSTLKGFADTVTGGYATKAANLLRKDGRKEKAYGYNEMRQTGQDTGIKFIDKTANVLPTVGAIAGSAYAGFAGGSKLMEKVGTITPDASGGIGGGVKPLQGQTNMPDPNIQIGQNVLTGQPAPLSPNLTASGLSGIRWEYIAMAVAALIGLALLTKKQ
jgi:hypothetical protein